MAEGGLLSWKRQKVVQNGPVADYSTIHAPLPRPPEGKIWKKDNNTKEWKLIDEVLPEILEKSKSGSKELQCQYKEYDFNGRVSKLKKGYSDEHDFVEHVVLPSDTFQGLCITYKITSYQLRQANMFSGSNLKLAPKKLIIPVRKKLVLAGKIRLQDRNSREFKIHSIQAVFPDLTPSEIKYYLDICNNDLKKATQEAYDDLKWEQEAGKFELKERFMASIDHQAAVYKALYIPKESDSSLEPIYAPSKYVDSFVSNKSPVTISVHKGVPVDSTRNLFKNSLGKSKYIEMIPLVKQRA